MSSISKNIQETHPLFSEYQSLDEFQKNIENTSSIQSLISVLSVKLNKLPGMFGLVIYTVDESFDFNPVCISPSEYSNSYEKNLQELVDNGSFANIIEQNNTVPFEINASTGLPKSVKTCILSPLMTKEIVLGMVCIYPCLEPHKINIETLDLISKTVKISSKQLYFLNLKNENSSLKKELEILNAYKDNIVSHITDCLIIMNSDFIINEINRAGLKLLGVTKQEITGKNINTVFTAESKSIFEKVKIKIFKEGEIRNIELETINKFGDQVSVNFSAAIFQNKKGYNEGIVAILRDITEIRGLIMVLENARVQIEEQNIGLEEKIRERTAELREKINEINFLSEFNMNILENMNSGVIGIDTLFKVNTFNRAASSITGIESGDILGSIVSDHPSLHNLFDLVKKSLSTKAKLNGQEIIIKNKDGKDIALSVSSSILFTSSNEIRGVMLVFADITIIREMHQQILDSERMAALGKMAASVAHEIRNPLNVIRGLAEVITKKRTNKQKIIKYMSVIIGQIDRLEFLLKEIVDFIKPRPPNFLKQSLDLIVKEVLETFREGFLYFSKKTIEIRFDPSQDTSQVPVDKDQFQQILFNLLKNSVDAIESSGNITIKIFEEPVYIVLSVEDDGCGMDEHVRKHAFDAFFTTKTAKGTGLGLSIVKNIMDSHKGMIIITSRKGKGTEIQLKFPKEISKDI